MIHTLSKENVRLTDLKSYTKYFGFLLIIAVNLLHASIYFRNTFPASEGWFVNYAELILRGKVPYRDFYYYLPPFTLFLDMIFWKLSFGYLILYRAWYLIERIIIFLLIYNLLSRHYKWQKAAVACMIASVLCTADDFDFFGDYNQNAMLLTVLLAYTATAFGESDTLKKKLRNLFLSGMIIGLMFLCKQTIFLASGLCYFVVLTVISISKRDKNIWRYYLSVAVGILLPMCILFCYLIANNAVFDFLDQVFLSTDGKGTIWDIVVTSPLKPMRNWSSWITAFILFAIIEIGNCKDNEKHTNHKISWILLGAFVCYCVMSLGIKNYLLAALVSYKFVMVAAASFTLALIALVLHYKKQTDCSARWVYGSLIFGCFLVCVAVGLSDMTYHSLFGLQKISLVQTAFNSWMLYLFILLFVSRLLSAIRSKTVSAEDLSWIMLASAAFSICYATTMAAGLDIFASNSMRITVPLMLCEILSLDDLNVKARKGIVGTKFAVIIWCVILCTITISHKAVNAYPWWGCYNEPMEYKTHTIEGIAELKGFKFAEPDKIMYETLTPLIEQNSDEDDIIFGYPYVKIFNILCHRYNSNFVPVIWYDVVGDKYVEKTIQEFSEKLPEIIVWKEIPGALETHEGVYRGGRPLVQRDLENMLRSVIPEKYTHLGEAYGVNVYRLNDEWR